MNMDIQRQYRNFIEVSGGAPGSLRIRGPLQSDSLEFLFAYTADEDLYFFDNIAGSILCSMMLPIIHILSPEVSPLRPDRLASYMRVITYQIRHSLSGWNYVTLMDSADEYEYFINLLLRHVRGYEVDMSAYPFVSCDILDTFRITNVHVKRHIILVLEDSTAASVISLDLPEREQIRWQSPLTQSSQSSFNTDLDSSYHG
jgi:hypothetical protein